MITLQQASIFEYVNKYNHFKYTYINSSVVICVVCINDNIAYKHILDNQIKQYLLKL